MERESTELEDDVLVDVNDIQRKTADLLCCPKCGKGCRTKQALNKHLKIHKTEGTK